MPYRTAIFTARQRHVRGVEDSCGGTRLATFGWWRIFFLCKASGENQAFICFSLPLAYCQRKHNHNKVRQDEIRTSLWRLGTSCTPNMSTANVRQASLAVLERASLVRVKIHIHASFAHKTDISRVKASSTGLLLKTIGLKIGVPKSRAFSLPLD
jgi:hypothetical protein